MSRKITAFQLNAGTLVLAQVIYEGPDEYLVLNPLELRIGVRDDGIASFQFLRWMPFNRTGTVAIVKRNVQGMTTTSPEFASYYFNQVKRYQAIQERIDNIMNNPEEHLDEPLGIDEDSEEPQDIPTGRTIH